jgi:CheY-like chemotaxis protein
MKTDDVLQQPRIEHRILLVEDDSIVAFSESRALKSRGYSVERAATGEEAVAMFGSGASHDLVLMDVELGSGIDGIETARKILSMKKVPLFFLSSLDPDEIRERAEGVGENGMLCKSPDNTSLLKAVGLALGP